MEICNVVSSLVAPALQLVLAVILVRRRLYRRFPFFLVYTTYSIIATILRIGVMGHPSVFYVLFWTTEMAYGVLALLALRETFRPALRVAFGQRWSKWVPLLALLAVVGISVWQAIFHPMGYKPMARLAAGAYAFMPGVLSLQAVVLFWCLLLAVRKNPPKWGQYRAGILVGFGIAALATVMADVARSRFGVSFESIFRYAPAVAYIYASVMWLKAFYYEEPAFPKRNAPSKALLRAVLRYIDRAKEDLDKGSDPLSWIKGA